MAGRCTYNTTLNVFILIGSCALYFISLGVLQSFGILYSELLDYFEATKSETSFIASIGSGLFLSFGPFAGILEEKYGCRAIGVLGSLLIGVGLFSSSFVNNMYLLYLTYGVITGIGFSLCHVAASVIVNVHFDRRRVLAVGVSSAGGGVGTMLLPFLVNFLIETYGWQGTFMLLSGMGLQGVYCSWIFGLSVEKQIPSKDIEKTTSATSDIDLKDLDAFTNTKSILQKTKAILSSRKYILFNISGICVSLAYFVPYLMVPDIAREQGISKDSIALMVTLSGLSRKSNVICIAARVIFGFVSDFSWWNRMVANGISLIILGAATSTVHLFNAEYFFFLYTILLGIVTGLFGMYQSVIVVDIIGKDDLGLAFGYLTFLDGIAIVLGPPMAGYLYDLTGDYQLTFPSCGILFGIGGILSIAARVVNDNKTKYVVTRSTYS